MSHWDYTNLPKVLEGVDITVATDEDPYFHAEEGLVKLQAADGTEGVTVLLDPDQAKALGKALFEAGHRAEWYKSTQRTL